MGCLCMPLKGLGAVSAWGSGRLRGCLGVVAEMVESGRKFGVKWLKDL